MIFSDCEKMTFENDKDLNILLERYECLNEEQLSNHLFNTFGINLIRIKITQ